MSTPIRNIELVVVLAGIEFTPENCLSEQEADLIQETLDQADIRYRRTVLKKEKLRFFREDVTVINEDVLQLSTINKCTIFEVVNEAITWAHTVGKTIQFTFNETIIKVNGDSLKDLILRDYYRSWAGQLSSNEVGPYPKPELSDRENTALYDYMRTGR